MTEAKTDALEARVAQLELAQDAENAARKRNSSVVLAISLTLMAIVTWFSVKIYNHGDYEWTQDKLTTSFSTELQQMNPAAMAQAQALGEHLLPIFVAEGRSQIKRMGPEISRRLSEQVDLMGNELHAGVHAQLTVAVSQIRDHTMEALFSAYPNLRDEAEQRRLTARFMAIARGAILEAVTVFDRRFSEDVDALAQTLIEFDDSESEETTVELQKRFIHLWLQLVDAEIMKL